MNAVLITGSRAWRCEKSIHERLALEPTDTIFIEGGCSSGADRIAARWCAQNARNTIKVHANWDRYGKAAGFIRNGWMLDIGPRLVLAFWANQSRGTADCIRQAKKRGIPVEIIEAL